jgi:MOSC domain-containing protein YiiM
VVAVNVGGVRALQWRGRTVTTGIWKRPVAGPVRVGVGGAGLDGDHQADLQDHGGPDKAVYAYAEEDLAWWAAELGVDLGPGTVGENLTVAGVDVTGAVVGEHWQVGAARLVVRQPRIPCYKLGLRMGDPAFPRRFAKAGRPGAYLGVLEPGELSAGDPVAVSARPAHGLTVGAVARAYHGERSLVPALLEVPELPDSWRDWARSMLEHAR